MNRCRAGTGEFLYFIHTAIYKKFFLWYNPPGILKDVYDKNYSFQKVVRIRDVEGYTVVYTIFLLGFF